jgi:hypothetical protein
MAYSKKRVFKKKVKSYKKRNSRGGGCGCSQNSQSSEQKGGGDYFLGGYKEPPSFSNVPISSFYPQNMHTAGADVQAAQISSRGLPNMTSGGGKKSRKAKKNKKTKRNKTNKKTKRNMKMKGGSINYSLFSRDPLLGNSSDPVSSVGNTSGAIQAANIFNQGGASNYASSSANMKATLLV